MTILLLILAATFSATPLFAQPLHTWGLDETSGPEVVDTTGGLSGSLMNGVERLPGGRTGGGIRCDGVDDYATIPDDASIEAAEFSLAFWVRRRGDQPDWAKILTKGNAAHAPWGSYKVEFDGSSDNTINLQVGFTDGTSAVAQTTLAARTWQRIIGTWNGTAVRLYRDGALVAEATVGPKEVLFDSVPLTFCGYSGWGHSRVDLDEVAYYDRALSQADVESDFSGVPPSPPAAPPPPTLTHLTFQPTNAEFPNPERGFYGWTTIEASEQDYEDLRTVRGMTLTRPYYRLDDWRHAPLPQFFLDDLNTAFDRARQAGVKIIPRFSYNFGPPGGDTTTSGILGHVQQLAPVLAANADVILAVEAGFVGLWGEWHGSTNGSDSPASEAAIINALMAALPSSRQIAVRYPSDLRRLQGSPLTSAEAFSGTERSRLGSHQDCFLASQDDYGTWGVFYDWRTQSWSWSGYSIADDKAYVADNGQYAIVGGETCNPNPPRSNCPTALSELASGHWTYLNSEYHPKVLESWKQSGCYDEIRRRLGYRFELQAAEHTANPIRGETFTLHAQITNTGFAVPVNARPVYAVMTDGTSWINWPIPSDPRQWTPGVRQTLSSAVTLPASLPPGTYTVGLWLPDAANSLMPDPRYAMRLAYSGVWDNGVNVLTTVTIP
jgi:hypothetical protein